MKKKIIEKIENHQKIITTNENLTESHYSKYGKSKIGIQIWASEIYCENKKAKLNKEAKKEYSLEYYRKNKEKIQEYQKSYRRKNAEKIKVCQAEYYKRNKEILLERNKQYRINNRDVLNFRKREYHLKYYKDHKEAIIARTRKYSENRKEMMTKSQKKYRELHRLEINQRAKEYRQTPKGQLNSKKCVNKRQRNLGFIPINKKFENSNAHHINKDFVIYIPQELHKSVSHNVFSNKNMKRINDIAFGWLCNQEHFDMEMKI